MKKLFLLFAFGLVSIACSMRDRETKIRFVDMNGNAKNVEMRTPALNMQALASQGNLDEEKIRNQASAGNFSKEQKIASNKYAEKESQSSLENSFDNNPQNAELNYSKQNQYNASSQNDAVQVKDSDILVAGEGLKSNNVASYSLLKQENSNVAEVSEKTVEVKEVAKKQSGIFVQTGSFSSKQRAEVASKDVKKFTTKLYKLQIEEDVVNDKAVFRVLIGPFSNKAKALNVVKQIEKSGKKAILIKNK